MSKPLLLDLFCGAGGCAVGYSRAGFDVVGVDIKPQPRYPFRFVQSDALEYVAEHGCEFDAIHASPPCQRYSVGGNIRGNEHYPDLVARTRDLLQASGRPYVIENVVGAPLLSPITICGLALGLMVKRHRLFESNVLLFGTDCPKGHRTPWVTVFGGGACKGRSTDGSQRRRASASVSRSAMGIDWMNRNELSQAIPPAYTEFIGRQLMNAVAT